MKKLKADILASYKNKKINVFILFLLFAFVILIFTKLSKNYTNTISFSVEKLNIPQENIILKDSAKINITLKTHGFKWLKYYWSKPKIKIDFSQDIDKKKDVFVWNKSKTYLNNTQFDKEVEILNISPNPITFRFGTNMVKKVPVNFNPKISFYPGFNMTNAINIEPDSITIIGPNTLVSPIKFLEVESVNFNDIRANINEFLSLKLPKNASDLTFSKTQIKLTAQVEKFTEGILKIPISIINAPKNTTLKYFPKAISVSYYVSLSNFNAVTVNDFKVVCDFNSTNENESFLIPKLTKKPNLVKNAKINQQRIEFIITE